MKDTIPLEISSSEKSEDLEVFRLRYHCILNATDDGMWDWDLKTDELDYTERFAEMLGYEMDELPKHKSINKQFVHPDDVLASEKLMQEHFDEGKEYKIRLRCTRKDGRQIWVLSKGFAIRDETGKPIRVIGTHTDITESIEKEAQLIEAREEAEFLNDQLGEAIAQANEMAASAEIANQAKSEFLANMSHEIRTPMNAVIGMSSLLMDTELSATQEDFVDTIRSSSESLLTIINDILDFSKIESGMLELEQVSYALLTCVEEAMDLFGMKAGEKGLELILEVDEDVPAGLVSDPTRLRQIVINLVGNAMKFTETGEIHVKIEKEAIDGDIITLRFSVRDTGIGMTEEQQAKLFRPFSQADSSTTRKFGGTGLGLTISKKLSELMGGFMWMESVEGEGTTFLFNIKAKIASDFEVHSEDTTSLAGKHILVVDNNDTNRFVVSLMVEKWGLIPHEVESAAETLEYLKSDQPVDVLALDYHMPEKDGLELAEEIRQMESAKKDLPIVMLSSVSTQEVRDTADRLKFRAILTKPIKRHLFRNSLVGIFSTTGTKEGVVKEEKRKLAESYPLRILLAEDNLVNQKVAVLLLKRMGYDCDVVENGLRAIEALEQNDYDLILMDMQMPELGGMETTERIRKEFPENKQPLIVALTAGINSRVKEKCFEVGMTDYLGKPLKTEDFEKALVRAYESLKQSV